MLPQLLFGKPPLFSSVSRDSAVSRSSCAPFRCRAQKMSRVYFYPDPYPISASLLAMKKHLTELISRVQGLQAIVFTDGDGVPLIKAAADGAPQHALRPSFLAMVNMAISRGHKMGLGKCNKMTTCYSNFQLVSFNRPPVLITLIGNSTANTGMMLNLEEELSEISEALKGVVDSS